MIRWHGNIRQVQRNTKYTNGRPSWLSKDRAEYWIPENKLKSHTYPIQILAFRDHEYENNRIPADLIEMENQLQDKPLYLGEGSYYIVIPNSNYKIMDSYVLSIVE